MLVLRQDSGRNTVSFTFQILPPAGTTEITVHGRVDLRASVEAMSELSHHPDFDPSHRFVIDLRALSGEPASIGELRVIAWALRSLPRARGRELAVVLPAATAQGRAERVRLLAELAELAVTTFGDIAEARCWARAERG